MTPSQSEMIEEIVLEQRTSIQAAAYTIYCEICKSKPMTPQEFHKRFVDYWDIFRNSIED